MSKKMLIEATHPEETRVVVLDDARLEELDVETSTKKQIKGNIYLAKVVRVEPSLQAAFVEYGGNRHGFLAFNEIHPDYYQIPAADLEKLKKEMQQEADAQAESDDMIENKNRKNREDVETVSDTDNDDALYRPRRFSMRKYRIQEVIHHGQKMLVQVTKEERGNKGAAMTTYLSLAGRYSVLMPKNANSGGVSRKIANVADRKRLKKIVESLPVLDGQSVIIRTAGKERTKAEIKRDFEYLNKTWSDIVEKTMQSIAPALIHEEANLIKRTLRDAMTDDIEEIIIEGEDAFKNAKAFLKLLMPRQVKKIKEYKKEVPLFQAYDIENQMEEMLQKNVRLKSGGYLVIDQAEALVAIDVNSGRATRERNIEETALKTNLEAADEVARQMRLRDLAGLVVIDFIDMEEPKNNYAVERRMKEALKKDRARIQMGRITGFGLMELSRQRLRSSLLETGHHVCPMCQGTGFVRSSQSSAMHVLHVLEEAGQQHKNNIISVTVPLEIALYVLNNKRDSLAQIENRYDVKIKVNGDETLLSPTDFRIEYEALPVKERKGFFARTIETLLPCVKPAEDAEKTEKKAEQELLRAVALKKKDRKDKKAAKLAKKAMKNNQEAADKAPAVLVEKSEKKADKKKNKPQTTGEEKFKVVRQEAMVVYDAHANSVVAQKKGEVVAVEPAKTHVEAVAKPKRARKKNQKTARTKENKAPLTDTADQQAADALVSMPSDRNEKADKKPIKDEMTTENGDAKEVKTVEKQAVESNKAPENAAEKNLGEGALPSAPKKGWWNA